MAIQNATAAQLKTLRKTQHDMRTLLHQLQQKRETATNIDTAELTALAAALTALKAAVDAVAAA